MALRSGAGGRTGEGRVTGDPPAERAEARDTGARMVPDRDRDGVDDRVERDSAVADDRPARAGTTPAATDPAAAVAPDAAVKVRGRTSTTATLALIVSLTGLYAGLSGRLAPVGLALSVVGALLAFAGLRASRPAVADRRAVVRAARGRTVSGRAVTGGGLAALSLLIGVVGVVVAILALNHTSAWLDSGVDQVSQARDWLDRQFPWLAD